jgi:hypothetical protein
MPNARVTARDRECHAPRVVVRHDERLQLVHGVPRRRAATSTGGAAVLSRDELMHDRPRSGGEGQPVQARGKPLPRAGKGVTDHRAAPLAPGHLGRRVGRVVASGRP